MDCEAVINGGITTWKNDFDGYYENTTAYQVQQDIFDYIISNPIIYREETKVDSVASIKNAFAQAKKKRHHAI